MFTEYRYILNRVLSFCNILGLLKNHVHWRFLDERAMEKMEEMGHFSSLGFFYWLLLLLLLLCSALRCCS